MIDLITIVFREELFFLQTQARSIELYIDSDLINTIFIVVNDDYSVLEHVDPTWWGVNAGKVVILHREEIAAHPAYLTGWSTQQLYKLLVTTRAQSEWSMCLDAKTWFSRRLELARLFNPEGKVRFTKFEVPPAFYSAQKFVEDFYSVPVPDIVGPGGVPFMFSNQDCREMIVDIEARTGKTFYDFFIENVRYPTGLTEFVLYSGYITKKYGSIDALYSIERPQPYLIVNIADFEVDQFDEKLDLMTIEDAFTISIHRRAYKLLSPKQYSKWLSIIEKANLITDPEITKNQLNTLR